MPIPHPPGHLNDESFESEDAKWLYLERAPELDATEPAIRRVAYGLWEASGGSARAFAILAQAYARDVIFYVTDEEQFGEEDIAPAGRLGDVLAREQDDCDAKARLFVALCRAVRLRARMVPHWTLDGKTPGGRDLSHVSAEIILADEVVPVELTLARARLGEGPNDVPKEPNGKWDLNEPRK